MHQFMLILLAFIAGVLLAVQNGFSAKLGTILDSPLAAAVVTFAASMILGAIILISTNGIPTSQHASDVPWHLWFVGGACSAVAISLYYFTIPRLGLSTMISIGLSGQLVFSVIAGHFGWLNLPTEPIGVRRIFGVFALVIAIVLINWKT